MMGERQVDQGALFYKFSLDRHVPADHFLRAIDRFVDLEGVRAHLAPFYSATGRPSIDPELLIRMLLVGYCFGIRSERRLCEEVHLNLAYRWFCRLGLDGEVPDHSTFSKNRHGRFRDCDLLRQVFESVVRRCMAEGLVGGEGFAVDASLIKADANRQSGTHGAKGLDPEATNRATQEYLAVLDDAAFGGATPVVPKYLAPADPASRWTGANGGMAFYAYSTIRLVVMLYVRYPLSLRNVEDLAHERGVDICHETVRKWVDRFGPMFAAEIRGRRVRAMRQHTHWRWHLDEVYVRVQGEMQYLWRAVDHEGEVLESFVSKERDKAAALKFMKKLMKRHGCAKAITTDGLRSYKAAMTELGVSDRRQIGRWANNRAENSHQPFRRRERATLRFRRMKTLQQFASVHATFHNHFNQQRHLVSREIYKERRSAALAEWRAVAS